MHTVKVIKVLFKSCANLVTAISPPNNISNIEIMPKALPIPFESVFARITNIAVTIPKAIAISISIAPALAAFCPANLETAIKAITKVSKIDTTPKPLTSSSPSNCPANLTMPAITNKAIDTPSNIDPACFAFFPAIKETAINFTIKASNIFTKARPCPNSSGSKFPANLTTNTIINKDVAILEIIFPALSALAPDKADTATRPIMNNSRTPMKANPLPIVSGSSFPAILTTFTIINNVIDILISINPTLSRL